jgi:hypothetical protein
MSFVVDISDALRPPDILLTQAMSDPVLFGSVFQNETFWTWKVVAKIIDGIRLTEEREIALFELCSGRPYNRQAHRAVRRLILLVGRRGGKDRFESAVAVWKAALCLDWKKYISAGEGAVVLLIGTDKKQANILHRYCHGLIEASPRLAAEVTRETEEWLEFKSGGSVQIITNDEGLARGRSAIGVIGTECCQWVTDDMSPSHDAEVVEAAVNSMGMCQDVPGGLLIMGSSVYRKKGWMYRKWKELHGNSDTNDICWFAPSRVMNPALPQSVVDEALRKDRAKNSAEYLNIWREDISDLVPVELLEEQTDWDVFERPYERGMSYTAHCDMASGLGSGVSHSSAAFSIAHRDFAKGLQIQDVVREVKAPFVPEVIC